MTNIPSNDLYISIGDAPLGIRQRMKPGQSRFDVGTNNPEEVSSLLRGHNIGAIKIINPHDHSVDGRGVIGSVFQSIFGERTFDPKICTFESELPPALPTGSRILSIDTQGRISFILINDQD